LREWMKFCYFNGKDIFFSKFGFERERFSWDLGVALSILNEGIGTELDCSLKLKYQILVGDS
jgi:hypothetical protein